ncbi:protein PAM68, chloroplastic-like [Chenopodium quinoa]|uniref:protein PAM68, chloroplastic-like n=1 Tax=Chenopodium quinoa TaxID=63459 RepID=UPI000B7718B5|nr:protein PAM68, chloroplastic-like [Chenopodium quinoa]
MESCSFQRAPTLICPNNSTPTIKPTSKFIIPTSKIHKNILSISSKPTYLKATLRNPKGFGAPNKKIKKSKKINNEDDEEEDEDDDEVEEAEQGIIPEIVTNRMINRMAFSVGVPLFIGLAFFPFFYYLKVGLKIDVPTWVPFIVSFIFFGTALLGVSYGIVSSSWDPLREGSFWGWQEAQKNWPVFWQSLRGTDSTKK